MIEDFLENEQKRSSFLEFTPCVELVNLCSSASLLQSPNKWQFIDGVFLAHFFGSIFGKIIWLDDYLRPAIRLLQSI